MCKNLIYFMCFVLALGVSASVTNAAIIAYWPFDEGAGDVAKDVVGGFDAQLTNVDWVAGQFGGSALQTDRSGDEILAGPGPTPTTQDLSVAWWMVDSYDSYETVMNKCENDSTAGYSMLLRPVAENNQLLFRIGGFQAYGGWGSECSLPAGAYNKGEWTHIVCTYDSATDTATVYCNGELVPNGNNNPKTGIAGPTGYCQGVNDPAQPLYIVGQREGFGGIVDEVAIWDHALSANDVMSVFTLGPLALDPRLAGRPNPADGATDVPRNVVLGWGPGESAIAHDVYMGTVFDDVNSASRTNPRTVLASQQQSAPIYNPPSRLDFGQTYYWRIDEVNAPTAKPVKGLVWSFTTEPVGYPVAGQTITVTASSAEADQGPENTVDGSGLADDLHSDELTAMWTTALGATGPAWIQYEFDRVLKLDQMWVWNHNGLLEPMIGFGCKEVTI
ncbi:MAG TPA: LamG domain-containing protein, partial [Sedimentisphaerales bacterium]|nr:LamG domain-containing protein [Sedimentisphaerales bacterium]